jgi:hypothetical protein
LFPNERVADVIYLFRNYVRCLLAGETGILKRAGSSSARRDLFEFGRRGASRSETKNRKPVSRLPFWILCAQWLSGGHR